MSVAADNFYGLEMLIIERLRLQVPQFSVVACGSALGSNLSELINPAAAFVLPRGFTQPQSAGRGKSAKIVQTWEVVICVPHIRDLTALQGTAYAAGPYLTATIRALIGWEPEPELPGYFPLVLAAEQPEPEFTLEGRAEFPIRFEAGFVLRGIGNG